MEGCVGLGAGRGNIGEEKDFLILRGIELCILGCADHSVVTIPTALSQLPLLRRMVPKCYVLHVSCVALDSRSEYSDKATQVEYD
jgi:hypothetical protein